jgi:uncharacterized protein
MRDIRALFPTDDPVSPDLLIGRAGDVEDLAARLRAGTHVVLAGPRRTGKSSVALAAIEHARAGGMYVAHADLWDHDGLPSLTRTLAESILANRGPVAKALRRAGESGRELRELLPAGVAATLRTHLGEEVELALSGGRERRAPEASLADAIALAQRMAEKDGKRIAVFLDEFQDVAATPHRFGDPDLLTKQLRARLQRSPLVTMLFAGSIEHIMRELFGPKRQALSQFGSFQALSPISPDEWRAGIAARYRKLDVRARPEAIEEIVSLGEGHPRTTMLIARETFTVAMAAREDRTIELADARGGYDLALQADRLRHEEIVQRLRSVSHAHQVATRLARGGRPYSGSASANVRRALAMLERAGIAEHRGRGDWSIPEPLLRHYLAATL